MLATRNQTPKKFLGFTLLELLVVMAIIGILAAIGLGSYGTVQSKARDAKRKSDLENVARALEMYRSDVGSYPATFDFDGTIFENPTTTTVIYMQQTPDETRGGHDYYYQPVSIAPGTNNGYRLFARLENTEDAKVPVVSGSPGIYPVPDAAQANTSCGSGCNFVVASTNAPSLTAIADP